MVLLKSILPAKTTLPTIFLSLEAHIVLLYKFILWCASLRWLLRLHEAVGLSSTVERVVRPLVQIQFPAFLLAGLAVNFFLYDARRAPAIVLTLKMMA